MRPEFLENNLELHTFSFSFLLQIAFFLLLSSLLILHRKLERKDLESFFVNFLKKQESRINMKSNKGSNIFPPQVNIFNKKRNI